VLLIAGSTRRPGRDLAPAVLRVLVVCVLASVLIFCRFGLNLGAYSLEPALIALYALVVGAYACDCLEVSLLRLALLASGLAVGAASYWINTECARVDASSASSLLLLFVIHLPFVFAIREERAGFRGSEFATSAFQNLALFCAVAGIVQFLAQFFVQSPWLFDFTPLIPEPLRATGMYNTVIPVGRLYKANGFFGREPSGFSFVTSLALLIEWSGRRRRVRLATYAVALLLSYSGTGIVTLLLGSMLPLGRKALSRVATLVIGGALIFWALADVLNLEFTLKRIGEFQNPTSSGYIRYIAPIRLVHDNLFTESWSLWLGHGPGSISHHTEAYEFHDPTWAKLFYEYGLLGLVLFSLLFVVTVRASAATSQVGGVLFVTWLVIGGNLLAPGHDALTLVLAGLLSSARGAPAAARAWVVRPFEPGVSPHA
jgi:hypothetical protein